MFKFSLVLLAFTVQVAAFLPSPVIAVDLKPGLAGLWYSDDNFQRLKALSRIKSVDESWNPAEFGEDWSAHWTGLLISPVDGDVTFHLETSHKATIQIAEETLRATGDDAGGVAKTLPLEQGASYPVTLTFAKQGSKERDRIRLTWSRGGEQRKAFLPGQFVYSESQIEQLKRDHPILVDPPGRPPEKNEDGRHVIVQYATGRFAGWPANGGVWSWGDEIVVAFALGHFKDMAETRKHSLDPDKPTQTVFARSLDGGETWHIEEQNFMSAGDDSPADHESAIQFNHPDFAMRCSGKRFSISYDRCRTWTPFRQLPNVKLDRKLTSRTDYLINGKSDCLFFLSAFEPSVRSSLQDRAFAAQTTDGGLSLDFLSWMTDEPLTVRSVMPSTVRVSPTQLISVMRRREDVVDKYQAARNWIDAYVSDDNGRHWQFLSEVAETDTGRRNGNPPSLVRLRDGRLCVAYGYRATPYGIRAKVSRDNGITWGPEIGLRVDGRTFDLGYPRMVQRLDGKLVTIYYFTTKERPEQHIAATIWDPPSD